MSDKFNIDAPGKDAADPWDQNADLFKTLLEDNPNRLSAAIVFPRIVQLFGGVAGKSVLDYGCGPGRFARALADLGAGVTAYDRSPRQLEIARSMNGQRPVDYISNLSEAAAPSFDCAVCFQVIVCNPPAGAQQVVAEIFSSLRPGGSAGIVNTDTAAVGRSYGGGSYTRMPEQCIFGAPYQRHFKTSGGEFDATDYWYTPEDLRQIIAAAGFEMAAEETIEGYFLIQIARKPIRG